MKKILILTLLALGLVACEGKDLDDPRVKDALNQAKLDVNTEDDQASDEEDNKDNQKENEDENENEDEDINRTYP